MSLSIANGVHMEPQVKLLTVRHKATGRTSTQSTNKTKKLLKSGDYVLVGPDGSVKDPAPYGVPEGRNVREMLKNEQANAQKSGWPLLWLAGACFTIAIASIAIVWVIR
jgi:hypothetical protein